MKKIIVIVAAIAAGVSLGDTQTVNGVEWRYTIDGGSVTLNSGSRNEWGDVEEGACVCDSISGDIEIPSKLGGWPVRSVGDGAFNDCSKITSIKVPASVESIGDKAFYGCTSLTNLILSEGLESIGDNALFGCPGVRSIVLPNSVKSFGEEGNQCSIRTTAELKLKPDNGRYVIKNGAIYDKELTALIRYFGNDRRVVVEPGVRRIGCEAFSKSVLEEVVLPESLELIDDGAFKGCRNLIAVELPANVKKIGRYSFAHCGNLCAVFYYGRKIDVDSDSFLYCGRIVSFVRKDNGWENEDGVLAGCRKRKGDAYTNDYWDPQELTTTDAKLDFVRRHLIEWAAKKDAKACAVLAKLYKDGKLKQSGDECEMKYLRLGCDASGKHGEYRHKKGWFMCQIGECYRTGRGVPVDYAEALKWYDKAQDERIKDGALWVGISEMFEKGQGVEKSLTAAFCIARFGVKSLNEYYGEGCSAIYERCGDLYRKGIGVKTDKGQSDKMYWEALQCRNLDAETIVRLRTKLGIN